MFILMQVIPDHYLNSRTDIHLLLSSTGNGESLDLFKKGRHLSEKKTCSILLILTIIIKPIIQLYLIIY